MTEMQYYSAVSILLNLLMRSGGMRCTIGVGANEYLLARMHSSWRYSSPDDPSLPACPRHRVERALVLSGAGIGRMLEAVPTVGLAGPHDGGKHYLCAYGVVDACAAADELRREGYLAVAVPELHLVLGASDLTTASSRLCQRSVWQVKDLVSELSDKGYTPPPVSSSSEERAAGDTNEGFPVLGWFHVACMNGGDLIAAELHGQLLSSGLYDRAEKIRVTLLGEEAMRSKLKDHIFSRYPKYEVILDSHDLGMYEWPSMKSMWDLSRAAHQNERFHAFYIHTKAASNCRPDVDPRIQSNLRNWRHCMSHFVIKGWASNIEAISRGGFWASGPLYQDCKHPSKGGIFAGNFWWASSAHISQLCDPLDLSEGGSNRAAAEPWICTRTGDNYYNQFWLETTDPYDFNGDFGAAGPLARERWINR